MTSNEKYILKALHAINHMFDLLGPWGCDQETRSQWNEAHQVLKRQIGNMAYDDWGKKEKE